jgi:tRNA threonylcarbamoyladenosine biosynthesis protein TsaB
MSLILNIDTATEIAQVNFAKDGRVFQFLTNTSQKDHAAFVQTAVQQLINNTSINLKDIDAVAVTAGPGSYTGLRVGMASAKGFCYALNKPLLLLNMLEVLTVAAQQFSTNPNLLFCPMIDARRMEVFTATYNHCLNIIKPPCPLILEENSFAAELETHEILFFGSGAIKWKNICTHTNALFTIVSDISDAISSLSHTYFLKSAFANMAYSEPFYLKDFKDNI